MKSFIVSIIIILGAYGFIYGLNKLFYRYSFFHSAPSIKTLSKGGICLVFPIYNSILRHIHGFSLSWYWI